MARSFIQTMEKLTGISEAEQRSIFEQIKANSKKLEACPKHDFGEYDGSLGKLTMKYTCKNCGGNLGFSEVKWYKIGMEHAIQMPIEDKTAPWT